MTCIKFRCTPPVSVEADWDETVLEALLRTGTRVPFFCRSGICGQCKSLLAAGEVMQVGTAPQILTEEEVREGFVLICRSVATTDCEIVPQALPRDEGEPPWPDEVVVEQASWPAPGLFHLKVAAAPGPGAGTFLFHPGQYSRLQDLPAADWDLPSRLYPATRPGRSFLDFYLAPRTPRQARSFEQAFAPGARLRLARPVGASALKEGEKGPAVIVSDRQGLPAVLSMLELLRVRNQRSSVRVLIRGSGEGWLERQVGALCSEAGIELGFAVEPELRALLERTAQGVAAARARAGARAQAYVKGDDSLARLSRDVLYAHGFRPWEVHAEILEGAVPAL